MCYLADGRPYGAYKLSDIERTDVGIERADVRVERIDAHVQSVYLVQRAVRMAEVQRVDGMVAHVRWGG